MATPATIVNDQLPAVALVGRVNVGKSTLFNKLTESRHALVSDIPGTTRTRNIGVVHWRGKDFRLIDTGGLTFSDDIPLEDDVIKQTELALAEADLIIFVADIQTGILPQEYALAKKLIQIKKLKPVLVVANKADTTKLFSTIHDREWHKLGLGEPLPVSAVNGTNLGDLLDTIYKVLNKLKRRPKRLPVITPIKVAVMGRPNVGKSSLFNKLIGEDRVIVSPLPHTTREPHDTLVEIKFDDFPLTEGNQSLLPARLPAEALAEEGGGVAGGRNPHHILFIDTAGIRRKTKVTGELEKIGVAKSIATINKSDMVLLVLDASEPVTDQDQQLAGLLREHTRSVIIVVNKWDTAEDNSDAFRNEIKNDLYSAFPHLIFAPIVFVSAKTSYRVHQIFPLIKQAWDARHIVVPDNVLGEFLKRVVKKHLPVRGKGVRHPKILGLTQLGFNPPMFEVKIKPNTSIHISYVHYLENRLREEFGFFASPIIMKLSKMRK